MSGFRSVYRGLPFFLRWAVEPVRRACEIWANLGSGLWVMEGAERVSGHRTTLVFAGTEPFKNHFAKAVFADGYSEKDLGRGPIFTALGRVRRRGLEPELFACEIPKPLEEMYRPRSLVRLPAWIGMRADLGAGSRVWNGKKMRQTEGLIREECIELEVTRDLERFEEFYSTVYQPYITERHETTAVMDSSELALRRFLEEGRELLLVRKGGNVLGGIVVGFCNGEERFWTLGVVSGTRGKLGTGMVSDVLYYFAIQRGREKGCTTLNFGYSRAFLGDGLIRYKREWGARLVDERMPFSGVLSLRVLSESHAIKSFLRNNPFVAMNEDGGYEVCGFVGDRTEEADALNGRYSRCCETTKVGLSIFDLFPEIRRRGGETSEKQLLHSVLQEV